MGRKKNPEFAEFQDTGEAYSRWHNKYECLHCLRARASDREVVVESIFGRAEKLRHHLGSCPYAPARWKVRVSTPTRQRSKPRRSSSPPSTQRSKSKRATPDKGKTRSYLPFSAEEVAEFLRLLVEFQAATNLADRFIELKATQRLFAFLNPSCVPVMPSRKVLGGDLLDLYASKYAAQDAEKLKLRQDKTGGRVNFLSDVWKNVSRAHLLGCQLSLFGRVTTIGLYPTTERHDGLALASQMEGVLKSVETQGWSVGAVITDNAGQCSRARRILALRWPRLVFLHCFAHDTNNLVKSVLRSPSFRHVAAEATAVVKCLNKSSSLWLKRVCNEMNRIYGTERAFIALADTRWNSMQACFASLLRVRTALSITAVNYRDQPDFPVALAVLERPSFWSQLRDAEIVVKPLCFASFKLQADENSLADVVVCFQRLYDSFSRSKFRSELIPLLEERWFACEQPLFLLAFYLHPLSVQDARALPASGASSMGKIVSAALFYYKKFIGAQSGNLRGEFFDWMRGDYTSASLEDYNDVSLPPLAAFWDAEKMMKPHSPLAQLAITVFSIAVNTATCERYFSALALVHTVKRNRMSTEKAEKIAVVRKHVQEMDNVETSADKEFQAPEKRLKSPQELPKLSPFGTPHRSTQDTATPQLFGSNEGPTRPSPRLNPNVATTEERDIGQPGDEDNDNLHDELEEDLIDHWTRILDHLSSEDDGETDLGSDTEPGPSEDISESWQQFPDSNDPDFPRAPMVFSDLRGEKATLKEMFGLSSTIALQLSFDGF